MRTFALFIALTAAATTLACARPSEDGPAPKTDDSNEINAAPSAPAKSEKPKTPAPGAATKTTVCFAKPGENPFGMRASVTLFQKDSTVIARYEQLPTNVGTGPIKATLGSIRTLDFHKGSLEDAKKQLQTNASLWDSLLQGEGPTYADWEAVSTCEERTPPKEPEKGEMVCTFDAEGTAPNPLAMRTTFHIAKTSEAFTATYEQLPFNVGDAENPVTIQSRHIVALFEIADAAAARAALLDPTGGLGDLVLLDSGVSYADVDSTLKCQ